MRFGKLKIYEHQNGQQNAANDFGEKKFRENRFFMFDKFVLFILKKRQSMNELSDYGEIRPRSFFALSETRSRSVCRESD